VRAHRRSRTALTIVACLGDSINDVVQGRPVKEAARNLAGMVEHGRRLGLRVVLADVLPWNRPHQMRDEWTDDGNHPSVEGHRLLGERAFRQP
jgi:hypothetical protein